MKLILRSFLLPLILSFRCVGELPPKPVLPPTSEPIVKVPLTDVETTKLLQNLETIEKDLDEKRYGRAMTVIRQLKEAATTGDKAVNLWFNATKEVDFEQKGRTDAEFLIWKKNQTKDANHARDAALLLQVNWLAVALMAAAGTNPDAQWETIQAATTHLDLVCDTLKRNENVARSVKDSIATIKTKNNRDNTRQPEPESGRDFLNGDVFSSVIAKFLKLEPLIAGMETNGARVPTDIDGIYDLLIMPYYRKLKMSSALIQAWSRRISQLSSAAESQEYKEAKEKFTSEKLPELRWQEAREIFALGQQKLAVQKMLTLINSNLGHRNTAQWISQLQNMAKGEDDSLPKYGLPDPVTPNAAAPASPSPTSVTAPSPAANKSKTDPEPKKHPVGGPIPKPDGNTLKSSLP